MKTKISELKTGQQFKKLFGNTIYVITEEKNGKIGYRHLITDYPDRSHHFADADYFVIPIS